jgi:hypothetical protein
MPVVIYGFPFGKIFPSGHNPEITVNRGAVSSLRNDKNNRLSLIQIDGSINQGNSGGPVVDEKGRLVGIAVAKIEPTNIGFLIPAAELSRMLEGHVGPIGLKLLGEPGNRPLLEARARMIDPLNHVQTVQLLIAPGSSTAGGPDADGNWPALTGAKSVRLNRATPIATTSFHPEFPLPKDRRLLVQTIYQLDTGKSVRTMTTPIAIGRKGGGPDDLRGRDFAALGPLVDSRGEPVKDCKVERDDSSLTIEVPAGVRVLSPQIDAHNAPMMLADVEGDFIAQVRVTGNMIPGTTPPKYTVKGRPIPCRGRSRGPGSSSSWIRGTTSGWKGRSPPTRASPRSRARPSLRLSSRERQSPRSIRRSPTAPSIFGSSGLTEPLPACSDQTDSIGSATRSWPSRSRPSSRSA